MAGVAADPRFLGGTDSARLQSLRPLGRLELDMLALFEILVSVAFDGGVVHEYVRAAVGLGDESESLFGAEPLHGACCH
jgi:hypothetical protein